jgi:hypothetical protein
MTDDTKITSVGAMVSVVGTLGNRTNEVDTVG